MLVWNSDVRSSAYDAIKDTPRPGHADLPMARYGMRDHRGGAGLQPGKQWQGRRRALAKLLLSRFGIKLSGTCLNSEQFGQTLFL